MTDSSVRAAIWDHTCANWLVDGNGQLPEVPLTVPDVNGYQRPEDMVNLVRRSLGIDAVFLRREPEGRLLLHAKSEAAPSAATGLCWFPTELGPPDGRHPVWERPGWLTSIMSSVAEGLDRLGRRVVGTPSQERHWPLSAIVCIPTEDGPVWLKAVPPMFGHEASVIQAMSNAPVEVALPTVLLSGPNWWVAEEFPASEDAASGDPLDALAGLQIWSAERVDHLRSVGCEDRSPARILEQMRGLTTREDLLSPPVRGALGRSLIALDAMFSGLVDLGVPMTVVHGDLHAGNARWTAGRWLLFDWTEASIGHPFADLIGALRDVPPPERARRSQRFAARWAQAVPGLDESEALRFGEGIGLAHFALNYVRIHDHVLPSDVGRCAEIVERSIVRLIQQMQ